MAETVGKQSPTIYNSQKGKIRLLALCSSPKTGGKTDKLLDRFIAAAKLYGADVEKLHLYKEESMPFSGKLLYKTASLVPKKVKNPSRTQRAMLDCDGFVIATPTYWFNVPGVLKHFIDNLTTLEEEGYLLEGKVGGFIVYSPQGGGINVLQNLAIVFSNMGVVLPPYSMLHFGQKNDQWSAADIRLLAKNMVLQIQAQRELQMNWDFDKADKAKKHHKE